MATWTEATEEEHTRLGQEVMRREGGKTTTKTFDRRYRSLFGTTAKRSADIFNRLIANSMLQVGAKKCHLLWGLMILKSHKSEAAMSSLAGGVDEKEFRRWGWFFLEQLSWLGLEVIRWENRKKGDTGNDCLVSVDCTHVPTRRCTGKDGKKGRKGGKADPFYSWKLDGPGLSYEVVLSIIHGDIVMVNGPYAPRDWNDLNIFRDGGGLKDSLDDGERVEGDDGHPDEKRFPRYSGPIFKKMQSRVGKRHETVNARLKESNCLKNRFDHDIMKHSFCFHAAATLVQLAIEDGERLFDVDYDDEMEKDEFKQDPDNP